MGSKRRKIMIHEYVDRIADALLGMKNDTRVNLMGVVTEIGLSKPTKGTDCHCTLKIVDESSPSIGIYINFFLEDFEKLPHVESAGDIIHLSGVVVKINQSLVNAVFYKDSASFALYEGRDSSSFTPYQVSSKFRAREQHKKSITHLRKWSNSHLPERASSDSFLLREIREGHEFNMICKVLHICRGTGGEWMLFVWDGTDAPPLNVHSDREEEFDNPLPLQLESSPLERDVYCKFPAVGTVLRMTFEQCTEKPGLHLLKAGKWVQFRNINFEVRSGLWCGILLKKSNFSLLRNDDNRILQSQRTYDERLKRNWGRMPSTCNPWPSHITVTNKEHEDVPFFTLMSILSHPEV